MRDAVIRKGVMAEQRWLVGGQIKDGGRLTFCQNVAPPGIELVSFEGVSVQNSYRKAQFKSRMRLSSISIAR